MSASTASSADNYVHTQKAPLFLLLLVVAGVMLLSAIWVPESWVRWLLVAVGALMALGSASFRQLTVRDEGQQLLIQFGPLPLFRRRVAYDRIETVERGRTTLLDGWGIHLSPRGGWTWNLWGFDCVHITLRGGRKLHLGTDDAANLESFLIRKTTLRS